MLYLTVVTLLEEFVERARALQRTDVHFVHGDIASYKPVGDVVVYVSPANSLGFMDGGIDRVYMQMFPGVQQRVKDAIAKWGKKSEIGRPYVPIGASLIVPLERKDMYIVSAPTMLLPQDVRGTRNCYYATMSILKNVVDSLPWQERNVEVVFTSMCCGVGKMSAEESLEQFLSALRDYPHYEGAPSQPGVLVHEPNRDEQPKRYENREFYVQ